MSNNSKSIAKVKGQKNLRCPYCKAIYTGSNSIDQLKCRVHNRENATVRHYPGFYKYMCSECGNYYLIDYGPSNYVSYLIPITVTNDGDIRCLAKFKSEFFNEFTIDMANTYSPEDNTLEIHYYLRAKGDKHPVFLTEDQAYELCDNLKEALDLISSKRKERYS